MKPQTVNDSEGGGQGWKTFTLDDFENATGNASTYCWFVWEKGFTGKPELGWFN